MSKIRDEATLKEVKKLIEIPEDEPIFILRAQDRVASRAVNTYGDLVGGHFKRENRHAEGGFPDDMDERTNLTPTQQAFVDNVFSCVENFWDWQDDNFNKVKSPDA